MEKIHSMSSRVQLTEDRAIFTYSYSEFCHDEVAVLLKYFDAFFYIVNWGTTRVMFKFPRDLVDLKEMKKYNAKDFDDFEHSIKCYTKSKYVLVEILFNDEHGYGWLSEEQDWLKKLLPIRRQIMDGDYRSLFLIWMEILYSKYTYSELPKNFKIDQNLIPPNLKKLNPSLKALNNLFGVNQKWLKHFAKKSENIVEEPIDFEKLLKKLSAKEKSDYLLRLLDGEQNLHNKLKTELFKQIKPTKKKSNSPRIKIPLNEIIGELEEIKIQNYKE